MRKLNLALFLSLVTLTVFGQISPEELEQRKREKLLGIEAEVFAAGGGEPEQDCNSAIAVCQSTYVQPTAYSGFGSVQEVPTSSCLGSREKNSVWYIFTVTSGGTLEFVIDPNANSDDYDFALYNLTGRNCSDILTGAAPEVRCNYCVDPGNTGLSSQGQNPSEPCCAYDQCQFSTILNVNQGETFVLVVSNYSSSQSGYTLTFGGTAEIFDQTPAAPLSAITPCGTGTMEVQLTEAVLCSSISANGSEFTLSGPGGPYTITGATGINCGTATSQIELQVTPQVTIGAEYTLTVNTGSDGNTLIDNCGNATPNGTSVSFITIAPDAEITGPREVCAGSPITLSASTGEEYLWSNGVTTQTITVSPMENTTYSVTITSGTCVQQASATVTVKESPIAGFTYMPDPVCAGQTVAFTNTSELLTSCFLIGGSCTSNADCGGLPCVDNLTFISWNFDDGTNSNSPNPNHVFNEPGIYEVSLNLNDIIQGCTNAFTAQITVLADEGPLNVPEDFSVCAGESATITASGGLEYTWVSDPPGFTGTGATIEVSPEVTTTYTVSSEGCSGPVSGSVTVSLVPGPEITALVADESICAGLSTQLTASGGLAYIWSPATGLSATTGASVTASPTQTTTYTVTGTGANGCQSTATVTVNVVTTLQPAISPAGPLAYCEGQVIDVTLDAGPGYEGYSWNTDESTQTIQVDGPGSYSVTVNDEIGCTGTDEVSIFLYPLPEVGIIPDTTIFQGSSVTLFAEGGVSYTWSPVTGLNNPNTPQPVASPLETIDYVVTVTDANGCQNRDTVRVTVEVLPECQLGKLFIPTAFSPNGDGLNDVFRVQITRGYDKFLLSIRDRWGRTVFETSDPTETWDGTFEGEPLSGDAFGYYLELNCAGRNVVRTGSVSLVR